MSAHDKLRADIYELMCGNCCILSSSYYNGQVWTQEQIERHGEP